MIEAVFLVIAVIFAALGLCDFLHILKTVRLFPGIKTLSYCIIALREGYAQNQLRFFASKHRWYGNEYCDKIIAVTDDLEATELASCERYCYGTGIYLCRLGEIDGILKSEIGETDVKQ